MSWGIILAVAFGAFCIVLAFLVRAGRSRTFYPIYRTNAPPWVRNRVFSLLPGGIALIAGATAVGLVKADVGAVAVPLMVVTWIAAVVTIVWLFRPPEFVKPQRLREVESGAAPEPEPGDRARWRGSPAAGTRSRRSSA